jgi:hypothetical protein
MRDTFVGKPRTLKWDTANNRLWIGIGDHITYRNMTTHEYVDLGQISNNYQVKRIFDEMIDDDELWGVAVNDYPYGVNPPIGKALLFRVIISTGTISSWVLANRTNDDYPANTDVQNFALGKTAGTVGGIFFVSALNQDNIYFFDFATNSEVQVSSDGYYSGYAGQAAWSNGADYFYHGLNAAGIHRIYKSGGVWYVENVYNNSIGDLVDAAYNATENRCILIYHTTERRLLAYNHSNNTITTLDITYRASNLEYRDGKVYYHRYDSSLTWLKIAEVSNNTITELSGSFVDRLTADGIQNYNSLTYNNTGNRFYGLTNLLRMLYMVSDHCTMFINIAVDAESSTLGDVVRELAIGFLLMPRIGGNKTAHVYRRSDDNGILADSGSSVILDADKAKNITEEDGYSDGYDMVIVKSGDVQESYNGVSFGAPEYTALNPFTIENQYFETAFLRDFAFIFYQYFNNAHIRYRVPSPLIPYFQYEPFDRVDLNFSGKINTLVDSTPKSGIIVGQKMSRDGTTEFEVLT